MPRRTRAAFLSVLLSIASGTTLAGYRGYIERPWTASVCQQESHYLTDPCVGYQVFLDQSQTLNLDPYLCTYVDLSGPDVGITCDMIIQPTSVTPVALCLDQFSMWFLDDPAIVMGWYRVGCATSYDLIRGNLAAVTAGSSQIDLGTVTCLANDVPQPNNWLITGPSDADTPPVGVVYFYLVRARSVSLPAETYGYSSDGRERLPFSGDCSF